MKMKLAVLIFAIAWFTGPVPLASAGKESSPLKPVTSSDEAQTVPVESAAEIAHADARHVEATKRQETTASVLKQNREAMRSKVEAGHAEAREHREKRIAEAKSHGDETRANKSAFLAGIRSRVEARRLQPEEMKTIHLEGSEKHQASGLTSKRRREIHDQLRRAEKENTLSSARPS